MSISTLPAVIDKTANNNEPVEYNEPIEFTDEEDFVDDDDYYFADEDECKMVDATDVLYFEGGIPSRMSGRPGRQCSLREIYELILQDHSHEQMHGCFQPTYPEYNFYTETYADQEMLVGISFHHPEWTRWECDHLRNILFTILGDRCRLAYVDPDEKDVYIVVTCFMDWLTLPYPPHTPASVNFHAFDIMTDVLGEVDSFFQSARSEQKAKWVEYRSKHGKLTELKGQLDVLYGLANRMGNVWEKRHYMAMEVLPICFDEEAKYREE